MGNPASRAAAIVVVALLATAAHGAVTSMLHWVTDVTIDSVEYSVFRLRVHTTYDWTNASSSLHVWNGTIYQHPYGGNGPASQAIRDMFPDVRYDSYWTTPDSYPNILGDGPGPQFPAAPEFRSSSWETSVSASWFGVANSQDDIGSFAIMQFTVPRSASWSISGVVYDADPAVVGKGVFYESGLMPSIIWDPPDPLEPVEPATFVFLTLGGLTIVGRRKG